MTLSPRGIGEDFLYCGEKKNIAIYKASNYFYSQITFIQSLNVTKTVFPIIKLCMDSLDMLDVFIVQKEHQLILRTFLIFDSKRNRFRGWQSLAVINEVVHQPAQELNVCVS